jgi:hypothetical protein
MTARDELRMHLAQAATRADDADARVHLDRALELIDEVGPSPLAECPDCGRVGPRPRVRDRDRHDCRA